MRKILPIFVLLMLVSRFDADACTNVIITPGASKDGSSIVSYAAESANGIPRGRSVRLHRSQGPIRLWVI